METELLIINFPSAGLRNTSYWVASNPELLKAMRVVSQEEPEELVDFETCDDTSSNWSEISVSLS